MLKRLLIVAAAIIGSTAISAFVSARALWRRWGLDPAEASMSLPGDDLVPEAEHVDTRGIDIAAPPAAVWPWLVQMGYGRAGWYSYDQLDMNHPSADRVLPEFQSLAVGDILPTDPGGGFEVKVLDPERALVVYADRSLVEAQRGHGTAAGQDAEGKQATGGLQATEGLGAVEGLEAAEGIEAASVNVRATGAYLDRAISGEFAASWAFVLEPRDGGTRLIERFRVRIEPQSSPSGQAMAMPGVARSALGFGVFVMVRRQMLGIRDRVEGRPRSAFALSSLRGRPTRGAAPAA